MDLTKPAAPQPSFFSRLILPPDFDPDRKIEPATWVEAFFEPATLIGTVVCFILGIVQFGQAIVPDWPTRFLPPLSLLVGVEAFLYSRRLANQMFRPKEWLVLLLPVLVLTRFAPYLDDPNASVVQDVALWIQHPAALFSLGFVVDSLILLLAWWIVFSSTQNLNGLRVQPGEIPDENTPLARQVYEDSFRAVDHSQPLRQLGQTFIVGGVILVILSSLAALGTDQVFNLSAIGQIVGFQRPSLQLTQINVILYFILGLLLLGEMHFVRQRTLWRLDKVAMPEEIQSSWVGGTIGLVLAAIVLAFILPTSYAMTLGDMISYVVSLGLRIVFLILGGFFYVFYLIMRLIGLHAGSSEAPQAQMPPRLPEAPPPPSGGSPLEAIQSMVFWIVALAILIYCLSVIWRRRGPWLSGLNLLPVLLLPWRVLRGLTRLVSRFGREVGRVVAAAVPRIFRTTVPPVRSPFRFVALSRLGPRELVEYFYLSVCQRAAQLGHARPPGMTPEEYERYLGDRLPLVDPELSALTAAFVEARYGPRPTTKEGARSVRERWQSLKQKLRAARITRLRTPKQNMLE